MRQTAKKLAALGVAGCLMFSAFGNAYGSPASDAKGHWAESSIAKWDRQGLMEGYPDGTFRPDHPIKRSEFIALVNKSFGFTQSGEIAYNDVNKDDWFYGEVAKAQKSGYVSGYEDGTFRPDALLTREEVAVIATRLLALAPSESAGKYADASIGPEWSKGGIGAVVDQAIMLGYEDGTFRPAANVTRAEALVILDRAMGKRAVVYAKAGEYGPQDGVETVNRNVTITAPGVTLQNMDIQGDLLLAESIGEGDVFLKNVKVGGKTIVKGGGEHSVHLENTIMVTVIVDKRSGAIRIVANGATVIQEVQVQTPVNIEAGGVTGKGISTVTLSDALPKESQVNLVGRFETVNVIAQSIVVEIPKGSVGQFNVDKQAEHAQVNVGKEASIVSLILNAAASVAGQGSIQSATVNAANVQLEKQPDKLTIGKEVGADAKITIGSKEQTIGEAAKSSATPSPTAPPAGPGPGTGSDSNGNPGTNPDTNPNPDGIMVTSYFDQSTEVDAANRLLYKGAVISFNYPVQSVSQSGGIWQLSISGKQYKIGLWNAATGQQVPISQASADGNGNVTLSVNQTLPYPGSMTLKLFSTGASPQVAVVYESHFPNAATRLTLVDNDRNPGVDGRDFTLNWVPGNWNDGVQQVLYLVPKDVFPNKNNHTPVAVFNDRTTHTWTGNIDTKDSLGNPIVPSQSYRMFVFTVNQDGGGIPAGTRESFTPVYDRPGDPSDPGPDSSVLPGPSDPEANVMIPIKGSVVQSVYGRKYTTVGEAVYATSNMDGYVYLVRMGTPRTVPLLETAVSENWGIRMKAKANEEVRFDTTGLPDGTYMLVGLSEKNATGNMDAITLYPTEATPLTYMSWGYTDKRELIVNFNKLIFNHLSGPQQLKDAVTISANGTDFTPLTADDQVEIRDNFVYVKFAGPLPADKVTIKIAANTLEDLTGKVFESDANVLNFGFGPTVQVVSYDPNAVGKPINIRVDKPATVYLVRLAVTGVQADYENEVVALRGKKITVGLANTDTEILTEGLQAGEYKIVAWGGTSVWITLQ